MHGELTFFEIGVPDSGRAEAFYARLFRWQFPPTGEGDQVWVKTPSIKGGLHDQDTEARIAIYFEVDDIDAAVRTVRELGGTAEDPRPEEAGFGRFTACTDDQGVQFGLHQAPRPRKAAAYARAARPVTMTVPMVEPPCSRRLAAGPAVSAQGSSSGATSGRWTLSRPLDVRYA